MAKGASSRWQPKDEVPGGEAFRKKGPAKEGKEPSWTDCITLEASSRRIRVAMAARGLQDHDVERWCAWFRAHLQALAAEAGVSEGSFLAKEVDFADNRLTSVGVRHLLEALRQSRCAPPLIKLHHNRIRDGGPIASYIQSCHGTLRELQLSHNELDAQAAADILIAVASAVQADGSYSYPSQDPRGGPRPMWLRLEQNYVSHPLLQDILGGPELERLKRPGMPGKCVLCSVPGTACTPRRCAVQEDMQPAIQCKYLLNQKSRDKRPEAQQSTGEPEKEWQPSDDGDHGSDEDSEGGGSKKDKAGGLVWKVKAEPDKHGDYTYPLDVMLHVKMLVSDEEAKASESERVAAARAVPSCVKLTAAQLSAVPEPPATVPASRKQRGEQKQRSEAAVPPPAQAQPEASTPVEPLPQPRAPPAAQQSAPAEVPPAPAPEGPRRQPPGNALAGIGEAFRAAAAMPAAPAAKAPAKPAVPPQKAPGKSGIAPPPSGIVGPPMYPRSPLLPFGHPGAAADPRMHASAAYMQMAAQADAYQAAQAAAAHSQAMAASWAQAQAAKGKGKGPGNGVAGAQAPGRKLHPGKEWAQLVAMLKAAPGNSLTISELQQMADMPLLAQVQDGAAFCEMLGKVPSRDVRVSGPPGGQRVSLVLGGQPGLRPEPEEEPFFPFNPSAAEFVPGTGGPGQKGQGGPKGNFFFNAQAANGKGQQQARPGDAAAAATSSKAKGKAAAAPKAKAGGSVPQAGAPRSSNPEALAAAAKASSGAPRGLTCPRDGWQYVDPKHNVQGPFTLDQMKLWHEHLFFHDNIPMRCDKSDPFVPLKELFPPPLRPFESYPKRPKSSPMHS